FMHQGDTIINVLPVAASLKTENQSIELKTIYPFENSFTYTIEANHPFNFKVRIPSFAENCMINGKLFTGSVASFEIVAGEKKVITMSFETTPHFVVRPYDLTTVQMGSLVFSVPISYEKKMLEYEAKGVVRKFPYCDYEYIPTSDWNYAYCSDELCAERKKVDAIPFSSDCPPVVVKTQVQKIDWGLADGYETVCAKVPESREPISKAQEIELYPYGCAKLRMTELPKIR
ncbi:MAG: hypothetical protein IJN87_03235, partial [Firmicutes bacterium]|nr:hypothetical protein [Bacillota bacterium]